MPGLACATQRRGVTPLVLLLNLSGHRSTKSRNRPSFSSCECSAATPLTEKLPTIASQAMRTCRTSPSSMIDMRRWRSMSPGHFIDTSRRKRALIS